MTPGVQFCPFQVGKLRPVLLSPTLWVMRQMSMSSCGWGYRMSWGQGRSEVKKKLLRKRDASVETEA